MTNAREPSKSTCEHLLRMDDGTCPRCAESPTRRGFDFERLCVLLSDTYEDASHATAGSDSEPPVLWADAAMHHRVAIRAALRAVLVELDLTPHAGIVIAGPLTPRRT